MGSLKTEQDRIQRELAQARALITQYRQDYEIIQTAVDEALLMCQYGALAYEHAEPEVRRQLIQAAFDKLWVMGIEIVGCDLKPGYVTLLDDELVAELERQGSRPGEEDDRPSITHVHHRRATRPILHPVPVVVQHAVAEDEDEDGRRLPAERPTGRLPWEERDTKQLVGVSGSNVHTLVGATGFEPVTPRL